MTRKQTGTARPQLHMLQSLRLAVLCIFMATGSGSACANEPATDEGQAVAPVLAKRGKLILEDDGSLERGGKTVGKFSGTTRIRAGAGLWNRAVDPKIWRSTWNKGLGHTPVASYQGFNADSLIIEVTFRYGVISEPWHTQCFRIAVDDRPNVTGHIVSAWANPNNDFIESGFLLQHIRKQKDKTIIEDMLLDQQPVSIQPEVWYTATLEVVGDEALFRMGNHVAYAKAEQIRMPKNLVSLTMGTTWHEIKRVRIWRAEANPSWPAQKSKVLESRKNFTPTVHNHRKIDNTER